MLLVHGSHRWIYLDRVLGNSNCILQRLTEFGKLLQMFDAIEGQTD